ncbi:VCBS repeat-containing protein [Planomonospora sp. ID67723]|uniref:VCBS repeat-containing protein n=1 Tax=Planomonospora sp. ID67723 TaxID=2738134 RepID=UPI0018C36EF1|nr:VCBS repeat-containing protein [Planomonospora sp. ID67723]MBG0831718.1 VCBS repeat-containing protein [Planomonospora sp. ID67723]
MNAQKIVRSAVLLALVTTLTAPHGPARASAPAPGNTDFNGDGYNDLAVGSPSYPGYPGTGNSGLIAVLFGGPDGLTSHRHIIRPAPGCTSWGPCTGWGRHVSAADVDSDGRTDLVSEGHYDMQVDSWTSQGATTIERRVIGPLLGPWGLTGGQFDDQPGTDMVGPTRGGYWFRVGGWYNRDAKPVYPDFEDRSYISHETSAAAGDIDGDGKLEMAVVASRHSGEGEPGPHLWLIDDPHRAPVKLTTLGSPSTCTSPPSPGHGCPKNDSKLAMGNVNGDGHTDLVMLTPSTASLQVWYGRATGPSPAPGHTIDLSSLPNAAELGPGLAVGDVNGDGWAEIAVGAAKATVSGHSEAGAVMVIPGSANGPVVKHAQIITQDGVGTTGGGTSAPDPIREQSRPGDHFGQAITIIDVTGDGRGEVIVGTPAKNGGSGMLAVLHGSATGVSATTAQAVHPSSYGLNSTQANFGGFLLK